MNTREEKIYKTQYREHNNIVVGTSKKKICTLFCIIRTDRRVANGKNIEIKTHRYAEHFCRDDEILTPKTI